MAARKKTFLLGAASAPCSSRFSSHRCKHSPKRVMFQGVMGATGTSSSLCFRGSSVLNWTSQVLDPSRTSCLLSSFLHCERIWVELSRAHRRPGGARTEPVNSNWSRASSQSCLPADTPPPEPCPPLSREDKSSHASAAVTRTLVRRGAPSLTEAVTATTARHSLTLCETSYAALPAAQAEASCITES